MFIRIALLSLNPLLPLAKTIESLAENKNEDSAGNFNLKTLPLLFDEAA